MSGIVVSEAPTNSATVYLLAVEQLV